MDIEESMGIFLFGRAAEIGIAADRNLVFGAGTMIAAGEYEFEIRVQFNEIWYNTFFTLKIVD